MDVLNFISHYKNASHTYNTRQFYSALGDFGMYTRAGFSLVFNSAIHIVYMYIILFNLHNNSAKSSSITPYFKDG